MNKNKKIISLICALAMIFSMLGSFAIVANADTVPAFTISEITDADVTYSAENVDASVTVKFTVGYEGLTGFQNAAIAMTLPEEVTDVKVEAAKDLPNPDTVLSITPSPKNKLPQFTCSINAGAAPFVDAPKADLVTITLTMSKAPSTDFTLTLADGSYINETLKMDTRYHVNAGEGQKECVNPTAVIPQNKYLPPKTTTTPGAVATPNPDKGPLRPVTPTDKGYTISEPEVTDTTVTFTVGYMGFTGFQNGAIVMMMPEEVTDVKVEAAKDLPNPDTVLSITPSPKNKLPQFTCSINAGAAPFVDAPKADLVKITLTLSSPLKADTLFALVGGKGNSYINETLKMDTRYYVEGDGLEGDELERVIPATSTVAKVNKEDVESWDIDFSDVITTEVDDTPAPGGEGLTDNESEYFIIPKVTVDDGNGGTKAAEYGTDYVVVVTGDDGTEYELTEDEYLNLVNGHLGADNIKELCEKAGIEDINDVVSKLKVRAYNSSAKVSGQLVKKATGDIVDTGNEVGTTPDQDNSSNGSLSLRNRESNVDTGENVSLPFTVTPAKDKKGEALPGTVSINVKEVSYNVLSATGVTVESKGADGNTVRDRVTISDADTDVTLNNASDNSYTIKFTPVLKTPDKEPIEFTVKYTDGKGNDSTATLKYNVRERSSSSGSSSSSGGSGSNSNGSSSDVLANGNTGSLTGGLLGGFTDMAGYDWAQTAVTALAMRNIVSGRGDGTFDPGGQITRAEYAQMLINAIGKSSDYADTSFNDVPTDAWFYHNVAVAAQLGIVSGYGDGNFGPYDLITREQMALMTQKAAIVMNKSLTGAAVAAFSDDADIADWAKAAVYDLANVGIINGMGDGTFAPKANATRAQAAVIIYSAFVK